jgi:hypothetical protein
MRPPGGHKSSEDFKKEEEEKNLGKALNIDRTGGGSKTSLDRPTGSSVSVTR